MPDTVPSSSDSHYELLAINETLRQICVELHELRMIHTEARAASALLQAEAEAYLHNQQMHAESYLQNHTAPDFYPFTGLPGGTIRITLPNGGHRFYLPGGQVVDAVVGQPLRAWDGQQHTEIPVPAAGSVTLPGGITVQIDNAFVTETITAECLTGIPAGSTLDSLGPHRYRVTLPNDVQLVVYRQTETQPCTIQVINPTGGAVVFNKKGITGIGVTLKLRLAQDGQLAFETQPEGLTGVPEYLHSGLANVAASTLTLRVAGGWTLTYKCNDEAPVTPETADTFACDERTGQCQI